MPRNDSFSRRNRGFETSNVDDDALDATVMERLEGRGGLCFRTVRGGRYPTVVRLAVGDLVVYASHGAGHVAARERRVVLGRRQEVVVLALAGGLSVELPVERAHELLRPLASEADLPSVRKALCADHAGS